MGHYIMSYSIPNAFLFYFIQIISVFIVAKLLTTDWKLNRKEGLFLLIAIVLTIATKATMPLLVPASIAYVGQLIGEIVAVVSLFLYFYKLKSYPFRKAIVLTGLALFTIFPVQALATWIPLEAGILTYGLLMGLTHIVFVLLLVRFTRRLRTRIGQSKRLTIVLAWLTVLTYGTMIIGLLVVEIQTTTSFLQGDRSIALVLTVTVSALFIIALLGFIFYFRSHLVTLKLEQKENERKQLQYYSAQIEQNYTAQRGFTHDIRNIFASMSGYIHEQEWDKLTSYWQASVEPAFEIITKNNFTLEALHQIKPQEIKSTLADKLMKAQRLGIDTTFEATDEIDHIPIDPVILVRMLGIILDNAIEALEDLGEGKLLVACFRDKEAITFIVQNTCRGDLPKLRELQKAGFSTKGENRGLGLNNLTELADSCPNVTLWTSIKDDSFTQKLIIEGV